MWKFKWFDELNKWKFEICRVNFPSKQSNSEHKARPAPARKFSHQIFRQNKAVKHFNEIKNHQAKPRTVTSCLFFIEFAKMKEKKEKVSFNKKQTKFLPLCLCFSRLILITRFSRFSLLHIFFQKLMHQFFRQIKSVFGAKQKLVKSQR